MKYVRDLQQDMLQEQDAPYVPLQQKLSDNEDRDSVVDYNSQ
jgi:hypothetical protein